MLDVTTTITTAAFERNHGKAPRGTGTWAFAPSTTRQAFDRDVDCDRMVFIDGSFATASAAAQRCFRGSAEFVAVMP